VKQISRVVQAVLQSPILWGAGVSVAFFWLIQPGGPLANAFLQRYTAGHPIEYCETAFFFVGVAVLVIKALQIVGQRGTLGERLLGPLPQREEPIEVCPQLLARLDRLPQRRQEESLVRRLRDALDHVWRCRSAAGLDDELRVLAEQEAGRQYASYAFLRIIIWAIPILGFLGTVIGITLAIANLSPEALEKSLQDVTSGLGVAFDTTALALSLAMVLMFGQYLVEKAETALLAEVERRAAQELVGRFERVAPGADGQVQATRRMAETMIQAADLLVRKQVDLWQESVDAAQEKWTRSAEAAGQQLQAARSGALAEGLRAHAQQLAAVQQAAAEQNRQHWHQWQQTAAQTVEGLAGLQAAMGRQGETLSRAVEAAGEVLRLEDALNRNLAALAGAKNFEQTVTSLAAALQLLSSRLEPVGAEVPKVHLAPGRRAPQAA